MTNKCSAILPDLSSFPNTTAKINSTLENSNKSGSLTIPKINCINGFYPTNSSICVCYKGWTDDNSGNTSNEVMKCNRVLEGFTNQTTGSGNSNGNSTTAQTVNNTNVDFIDGSGTAAPVSTGLPSVK